MTVTTVIQMSQVRKGQEGPIHGAFTTARTICGNPLTRAYQTLPGRNHKITCPACQRLLSGRSA